MHEITPLQGEIAQSPINTYAGAILTVREIRPFEILYPASLRRGQDVAGIFETDSSFLASRLVGSIHLFACSRALRAQYFLPVGLTAPNRPFPDPESLSPSAPARHSPRGCASPKLDRPLIESRQVVRHR